MTGNTPSFDRFLGCLLGGAAGDALGAPVEFATLAEIRAQTGGGLLRDYLPEPGRSGPAVTDDTQMALFTAEGLMRAHNRGAERGIWHVPSLVHSAYLRWLSTQGETVPESRTTRLWRSGWLLDQPALHERRAPGSTCLAALRSGRVGTIAEPINDSKGCGGVMRVAPVGLLAQDPFGLACELAAITHGHPSGYLSAGVLAAVIGRVVHGEPLPAAIDAALAQLRQRPGHEECLAAVERAMQLVQTQPATPETLERLGGGWVGEEALAIALFCALTAPNFEDGVALAVTHSGDADSTGAIAGNILGAMLGAAAIPERWLAPLTLRPTVEQVARDLYAHAARVAGERAVPLDDWDRYPGY